MKILSAALAAALLLATTADSKPSAADRCVAAKWKASAKRFSAVAKCEAKAVLAGTPVDSACLQAAEDKFLAAFAKAEASGACTVNDHAANVDATLGECVADVDDEITRLCGDGTVAAAEDCDDGNTEPDDGCSATCEAETGFECSGEPSACASTCADGVVAGDEECDDGDASGGDGCDAACVQESGWTCSASSGPSTCFTICGDGLIRGTEECDDRNTDPDDGCAAACSLEPGWDCSGEPTACTCSIDVAVTPASGIRLPQLLTVSAADTISGCGLPLQYFWTCSSPNTASCPAILDTANANGNTTSSFTLPLGPAEIYNIGVVVCVQGTSQCAPPVTRNYAGDEI